jgi:hypothetical protein
VTAGAATAHNGPGSTPGGRGLLVARPGGASQERPAGLLPCGFCANVVRMLPPNFMWEGKPAAATKRGRLVLARFALVRVSSGCRQSRPRPAAAALSRPAFHLESFPCLNRGAVYVDMGPIVAQSSKSENSWNCKSDTPKTLSTFCEGKKDLSNGKILFLNYVFKNIDIMLVTNVVASSRAMCTMGTCALCNGHTGD